MCSYVEFCHYITKQLSDNTGERVNVKRIKPACVRLGGDVSSNLGFQQQHFLSHCSPKAIFCLLFHILIPFYVKGL